MFFSLNFSLIAGRTSSCLLIYCKKGTSCRSKSSYVLPSKLKMGIPLSSCRPKTSTVLSKITMSLSSLFLMILKSFKYLALSIEKQFSLQRKSLMQGLFLLILLIAACAQTLVAAVKTQSSQKRDSFQRKVKVQGLMLILYETFPSSAKFQVFQVQIRVQSRSRNRNFCFEQVGQKSQIDLFQTCYKVGGFSFYKEYFTPRQISYIYCLFDIADTFLSLQAQIDTLTFQVFLSLISSRILVSDDQAISLFFSYLVPLISWDYEGLNDFEELQGFKLPFYIFDKT